MAQKTSWFLGWIPSKPILSAAPLIRQLAASFTAGAVWVCGGSSAFAAPPYPDIQPIDWPGDSVAHEMPQMKLNVLLGGSNEIDIRALVSSNKLMQPMSEEDALRSLASTNASTRLEGAWSLDERRRQVVQQLLSILRGSNADEVKVYAVVVLGQYRATEAVPSLVNNLELGQHLARGGGVNDNGPRDLERNELISPVSSALVHIGSPAVPELLARISATDNTNVINRCVRLCRFIVGSEVTQSRLQGLLDKATDTKRKVRLQSALDVPEDLNF